MEFQEVFCPECGKKTKVDLQKTNNFCQNCGHKIEMLKKTFEEESKLMQDEALNIDEKLEEVKFYYETSIKKKEAMNKDENPTYYLKAQDLLVELSEQQPSDYRIWWELSKPLDYDCEQDANDINGYLNFNEDHFNKALDLADIDTKKKLIRAREEYEKRKKEIKLQEEKRLAAKEAEKKQIELEKREQQRKQQKEIELKRQEEEKARQHIEACTVKGVVYNTLEEADRARYEQKTIDELKEKLLHEKSRKRQQTLLDEFDNNLQIPVEQKRYEDLKSIYANKDLSHKLNFWYGISIVVCLVIAMIVDSTSDGSLFPTLWAAFGIWIWPVWKIVLVIKNKRRNHKVAEI